MTRTDRQARRHFFTMAALPLLVALAFAPEGARAQWATNGNNINNTNTGNVGIGTTTPITTLHVKDAAHATINMEAAAGAYDGAILFQRGGVNQWFLQARNSGAPFDSFVLYDAINSAFRLTVNRNGNVGIGTATPGQKLTVTGGADTAVTIGDRGTGGSVGLQFLGTGYRHGAIRFDGDSLVVENASSTYLPSTWYNGQPMNLLVRNGSVGIGTANPNYRLVVGPEMQSGLVHAAMTVSKGAGASASIIVGSSGSTAAEFGWDNANTRAFFNSPGTAPMAFTQNGSNVRMFINSAGNVGIGTTTLDAANKLTVDGNVHVTGNIAAKYQDVAEWVPSRERLQAGTVVVLDTTASNHVVASTGAYDTGVAGVVSEQPGIILGEGGEGKVKVATTGRVRVRVDATRAPVRIGDLLVTGDSPGVAMKSEAMLVGGRRLHAPGTIVGKALEPLEKGVAEILVLLSLQ